MSTDEILTVSKLASLLHVHPRTVYKLVKQGFLPGRKFGGGWRFSKRDVMQMISPREYAARPHSDDLKGR